MQLAQPIFLWALAGLSIPLAIHLLSRKEGKVIRMGSLRHLRETSTQQFRGIKLNEILLLMLRSLLVILFALIISGLYWNDTNRKWLIVEKGLENNISTKKLTDSLTAQGFEWHWLQSGFPEFNTNVHNSSSDNWSLLSSLQQQEIQQAIVLSTARLENFMGARTAIDSTIQWITIPDRANEFMAEAIQYKPDQLLIRKEHSEADYTSFETQISSTPLSDSIEISQVKSLKVIIASDPSYEQQKLIIKASLTAITKSLPINISISEKSTEEIISPEAKWLFWISDKKLPVNDSVNVIAYKPQPSDKLLKQMGFNQWVISQKLNVDNARENNFTLQIASLMTNEKERWTKVITNDRRVLPDSILFKGSTTYKALTSLKSIPPVNKWILLLFLSVLIVERFISYQRNQ